MLKETIQKALAEAWSRLGYPPTEVSVLETDRPEFGDYATNLALVGARIAGCPPRRLAEQILEALPADPFARVEIAGPGFINLFLRPEVLHRALARLLEGGSTPGRSEVGAGRRLQVEFVSSNPTGPLTVGHGRQAALGDALASLYERLGYTVHREYYFNDEGRQIDLLAESLWVRYRQQLGEDRPIPDGGYQGDYLVDIARELVAELGDAFPSFDDPARLRFRRAAIERIRRSIDDDLRRMGISFDHWFSETTLHERGAVTEALGALREKGAAYDRDGAVWLRAEAYGGAKDSVLVRSDGRPTYLLVDIAYHIDKRARGFDRVIDVQGADHQVEQTCVKAALRALGYPEEFLQYAVHQFVSLKERGETLRMSTRAGRFVTLRDLIDELGTDIVRYFMVARKPEAHLDFDLDLARAESLDNPVTYIQYAYTRIASIFRKADRSPEGSPDADLALLDAPEELDLIRRLDRFAETIEIAALSFAPHLLAEYLHSLARAFHAYYDAHRVLGGEAGRTGARLALLRGVRAVILESLSILGMQAPEVM